MFPTPNLDSYQRQANDLTAKINQLQQMQQYFPPAQQVPKINYVSGMDGARKFLQDMPAGGETALIDRDQPVLYIVSKDANGIASPIAFSSFKLETEQQPEEPAYVTKQDFEQFKTELKELLKGDKE